MTPAEFAEEVVIPTVRDFVAKRGDRRCAYLACIATYHLVDHLSHAEGNKDAKAVWLAMKAATGVPFEVVHGICNGTKHPASAHGTRYPAGGETLVRLSATTTEPAIPLGTTLVGAPGSQHMGTLLSVPHGDKHWTMDWCVIATLRGFVRTYPQHLGTVDLSFLSPPAP